MMRIVSRIALDRRASSAAEFALVLPLLLIFLLGMLDVGRLMWTWNRAEKATQAGVRYAVVTKFISDGLFDYPFTTKGGVGQGNAVPNLVFDHLICTQDNNCSDCTGTVCEDMEPSLDTTAFDDLVARMHDMLPQIGSENVEVEYRNVGLGFAGDPNGSGVAPLVTVKLQNLSFTPITFMLFNGSITLPSFSAALTMEDGQGSKWSKSN
ncbi:TadE/TadG family type IV pilus assembly protein [Sphingobium indicum]|uniref:TadE/TadG family type IV pilus assembly protein n=1 Tax=Sphingobium TaxID=165695 RepID=UPI000A01FC97|nr:MULTISPECIES: TadE/TadG family type IV pilus assembly protein [Sphingobium]